MTRSTISAETIARRHITEGSGTMTDAPARTTADLSGYPDLVVIYLGMRVEEPRGLETLQTLGPQFSSHRMVLDYVHQLYGR